MTLRQIALLLVLFSGISTSFLASAQKEESKPTTLNLGTTVTGNQEQPKVISIIPWQSPETDNDLKTPIHSLIKTNFQHLEPSELRRQIRFIESGEGN